MVSTLSPVPRFCFSAVDEAESTATVYECVCRTDFATPGFCLIDLGPEVGSQGCRHSMVELLRRLDQMHQRRTPRRLAVLSAARFDQQETTRPHRDGGPEQCFLMLGYEPSEVRARLEMLDYSRCAEDMGLTPSEFLEKHNPMFAREQARLRDYTTPVHCFRPDHCQIVLINNSSAPRSREAPAWQGVLHTATIENPTPACRRVVNSLMVASVPFGDPVVEPDLDEFVQTNLVRRRGYDKLTLEDES